MSDLTLVVIGKDWASLRGFNAANVEPAELILIANFSGASLASIGNHYLNHSRTSVAGFIHADCQFHPGAMEAYEQCASKGAVCGIVGITHGQQYLWGFQNPGAVETLDSCSIFLRPDLGLRFDATTFDTFHCHVQDLCMQAHKRGIPVLVPAANATHAGVNYADPPWREQYAKYKIKLYEKWGRQVMVT